MVQVRVLCIGDDLGVGFSRGNGPYTAVGRVPSPPVAVDCYAEESSLLTNGSSGLLRNDCVSCDPSQRVAPAGETNAFVS